MPVFDNTGTAEKPQDKILIIKLGAFGDVIQAMGLIAAIRRHHPDAQITLLTTAPFVTLARQSGYIDRIWTDIRPKWTQPAQWIALGKQLRGGAFDRVYDLQNNDRTALYFRLFGRKKPEWVGTAHGASHRAPPKHLLDSHAFDRQSDMLALADITDIAVDDLHWIKGDISDFGLPRPYVLLVPGSAPKRPEKRWDIKHYGRLARYLYGRGYTPVIIGTRDENELGNTIRKECPQAINLCGKTAMTDLAALARGAAAAIGNDTGPMHMIGPTGCPTIILFSPHSDPQRSAALGPHIRIFQPDDFTLFDADALLAQLRPDDFRHRGVIDDDQPL